MKYLVVMIITATLFIGCSKNDEELYNEAADYASKQKVTEAINSYRELVKQFPNSALASKSLYEIGRIYQGKLDTTLTAEESYHKAIETYLELSKNYKNSEEAPIGLFMVGFIQANELNNYDEATKTYKRFLEEYPQHDLAKSAQDELDNMGLSPEEILAKKLAVH